MKNSILSLAALALFTFAFSSCKKDPTFKEQIVGNWKSVEVKSDDTDLSHSNSFNLRLQSSAEFDLEITATVPIAGKISQSFNGDWTSDDAKQDVTLQYNGTGETKTWEILTLSDVSMTAELFEDNIRYQVKFERQ